MQSFEILFACLLFEEIIMLGWYDFPTTLFFSYYTLTAQITHSDSTVSCILKPCRNIHQNLTL